MTKQYTAKSTRRPLFTRCKGAIGRLASKSRQYVLGNDRGDFYISDAVRIIVAVVLGALLLGALTLIFNDTVIPRVTEVINDLFS